MIPELVFTNEVDGYNGINYAEASAVLVEAIKEQQKQIEDQQKEIDELKVLVHSLAAKKQRLYLFLFRNRGRSADQIEI